MMRYFKPKAFAGLVGAAALAAVATFAMPAGAQDKKPIKIGFGMAQTGPLGPNGKSAMLAMDIWVEEINAKGGLLGRPVELVHYDDQSNPSTVPGIYTKLLDVDKVDIIVGGYGTNMIAPAMPIVMQRKKVFMALYGLGVNDSFKYDRYFAMIPSGPEPTTSFTQGFFDTAMAQNPKPKTVAIVAADAEFSKNASDGARLNAKKAGLQIVYDKSYPPSTTDFAPIVRAIQATNADLVVICSYPLDSVGMVQAVNEAGLKPKMIGGAMVGLQSTVFKTKLGEKLNGFMNYDFWLPAKSIDVPRHRGVPEKISGARRQGRRRSARLLYGAVRLHLSRRAGQGDRGDQESRRRQAHRLPAQDDVQDHRRRHQVRAERRMGQVAGVPGAIPRHQGQRRRSV